MANIEGLGGVNIAQVDGANNLWVTTPQANGRLGGLPANANYVGAIRMFSENDSGALTGNALLNSPYTTYDNNLQAGLMTPRMDYVFNGTSQDTSMWYYAFTTMTAVQSAGALVLNNGNIGTTATGCYMMTKEYFPLTGNAGLRLTSIQEFTNSLPLTNEMYGFGLGVPASTTAQPTDGIWLQFTSIGLVGTMIYGGGSLIQTGFLPFTPALNTTYIFMIRMHDRECKFFVNDQLLATLTVPAGNATPFMSDSLPGFIQMFNSSVVSGSNFMQPKIFTFCVDQLDSNLNMPYPHIQCLKGLQAYQGTEGGTMGSTALYSNSLASGAGVAMTNTTAALGTGLGGQFTWQPTLAVGTDGILCSYLNPVGSVNQTPRTMMITGVRIQSAVSTTALTGGPVVEAYSLAYGHTALTLATTESGSFTTATAKAPRRIALGFESFASAAAVGAMSAGDAVHMSFASPIPVNPGEYIAIVAKNLGVVTTAGVITSLVTFDGYLI